MITLCLVGSKEKYKQSHSYWKLNNNLLKDTFFNEEVKSLAKDIFEDKDMNHIQKWEFFKFKVRELAIYRSKVIKKDKLANEERIMN